MLDMFAQFVKKVLASVRERLSPHILLICPAMVRQTVKILFPDIPSLPELLKLFQSDVWSYAY